MNTKHALTVAAVALAAAASLTGCGSTGAATPAAADAAAKAASAPPLVVELDGARTRPYGLAAVQEFARSEMIKDVVVGTVTKTEPLVIDGTEVYTLVTLKVDAGRSATKGRVITARELGGVVPLETVSADFQGHLPAADIQRQADRLVDYRASGQDHAVVGERLLVFLGGKASDPGGQYIAARMTRGTNGGYRWTNHGHTNPAWVDTIAGNRVGALFGTR